MANEWVRAGKGRWSKHDWKGAYAGPKVDPYFAWADVTDFADLEGRPKDWIAVLLELSVPAALFAKAMEPHGKWIRVPDIYRYPSSGLEDSTFCTASVKEQFFEELRSSLKNTVLRFEMGFSVISPAEHGPPKAVKIKLRPGRRPVVVGVIDDGLAFANARFRENGSEYGRVEYFWNQDEEATADFKTPFLVPYGREISREQIKDFLSKSIHGGLEDEDYVYDEVDNRAVRRRATHGTHVMDVACGLEPSEVTPASTRIVGVHLPTSITSDTSSRSLSAHALDALRYVVERADSLRYKESSSPATVVINLSYGNIAGPHDGSSILEAAMDDLIERRNDSLALVLPAGNSFLSRCHAAISIPPKDPFTLTWRILPDDATPSFLEVWLPPDAAQPDVDIQITAPTGEQSPPIEKGDIQTWMAADRTLCTVVYLSRPSIGNRGMILVAVAPSSSVDAPRGGLAPHGDWKIHLHNRNKTKSADIHAWIQRDDTPYGYRIRGRQSRFEDAAYERYLDNGRHVEEDNDSYVKRDGTLNGIATGDRTVVMGGFVRLPDIDDQVCDGVVAPYSASGPLPDPAKSRGPDALAACEDSFGRGGLLASGVRSGSAVRMNGTSVAAPQVTRWLAEKLAGGKLNARLAVQKEASRQEADRKPQPPYQKLPGKKRSGSGRMDLPPVIKR